MSILVNKILETLKVEELKNSKDTNFHEVLQVIDDLKKLGLYKKTGYTLPPVNTLGRPYYPSPNRKQVWK